MVVKLVESLAGILNYHDQTIIDSSVFRLHYRWTSTMLFLACILLTSVEIIGHPITCMGSDNKKADAWVLNYCWITSTYTLDVAGIQQDIKDQRFKPGNIKGLGRYDPRLHETVYHAYYQWVPFLLFGMGCFFYIPHLIWKKKEGKTVEHLLQGLDRNSILDQSSAKVENIIRYIQASQGVNGHYFHCYMGIEFLNLINVVAQMCLLDTFIGGQFWHYGIKSLVNLLGDENLRQDPMIRTFPRITKCKFSFFGPSGTIENHDKMCILSQNVLNEKIFLLIWIWFIILTTITSSYVVMRLVLLLFPILNDRLAGENDSIIDNDIQDCEEQLELTNLKVTTSKTTKTAILKSRTLSLGDFCLLELLQENLDYATFQGILKGLQGNYSDPYPGFLWVKAFSEQILDL